MMSRPTARKSLRIWFRNRSTNPSRWFRALGVEEVASLELALKHSHRFTKNISLRITVAVLLLTSLMSARDRSSARSMVVTRYGIVATSHVQASVAGAQVLASGGSAVDAAIAANAV